MLEPKQLTFIERNGVKILSGTDISKELVGAKAFGLSALPKCWTLPFFVISSDFFEDYKYLKNSLQLEARWKAFFEEAIEQINVTKSDYIFIRSNSKNENMNERGKFESQMCQASKFFQSVNDYFDKIYKSFGELQEMPLLIQVYANHVTIKGHVSNEKRISRATRDWRGQIESSVLNNEEDFSVPLRSWRKKILIDNDNAIPLSCESKQYIRKTLQAPCMWALNKKVRVHFEWIINESRMFIVQADEEIDYGENPLNQVHNVQLVKKTQSDFKVLKLLQANDKEHYAQFAKVRNALVYSTLGIHTPPIYILKNEEILKEITEGNICIDLINDLNQLLTRALVIRVDIETSEKKNRQMLPRTDEIKNIEDAKSWLICISQKMYTEHQEPFMFIFHNFIPAKSSIFSYAAPGRRYVLCEALWGLPEGLYYYSHDKYVLDTKYQNSSNISVDSITIENQVLSAKNNFIYSNQDGAWVCGQVHTKYIWAMSALSKKTLYKIAYYTRKIVEYENSAQSIMWFIGVNKKIYQSDILPWHHEQVTDEVCNIRKNKTKTIYEKTFKVQNKNDINELSKIAKSGNQQKIKIIILRPTNIDIVRNKDTISQIGSIAQALNAIIHYEGGILSHAYYQLTNTGAIVEVNDEFAEKSKAISFNKLVRDKIPEKIKKGGEYVRAKKIGDDSEMLKQLKIKLVEEALEVCDTLNTNTLAQEVADVLEVIDAILQHANIPVDLVHQIKQQKKEKAGGFEEGIILQKTAPFASDKLSQNKLLRIKKNYTDEVCVSIDTKISPDSDSKILRLKIPVHSTVWGKTINMEPQSNLPPVYFSFSGKRAGNNINIIVEAKIKNEQVSLFTTSD